MYVYCSGKGDKKNIFLLLILVLYIFFSASIYPLNHQVSVSLGNNGGTGYQSDGFDISARYDCAGKFWNASGGLQYSLLNTNLTGTGGFFWKKFGITVGANVIYHVGFFSNIGVEQDIYGAFGLSYEIWKTGFSLHAGGGIGMKFTSIYAVTSTIPFIHDLNGFYTFAVSQKFGSVFLLSAGISTAEYFRYNLTFMPNLFVSGKCSVAKNWLLNLSVTVRFTDMITANSAVDYVAVFAGFTYKFGE